MSSIAAGTTLTTALVATGDTSGQLTLQTNGTTTAVTIGTDQVVTLAQPLPIGSGGTGATTLAGANLAVINTSNTFTAAQTFRAANAVRSEAASTQDAIVLAGRAGGTSSYAVTFTPATLTANRTLTAPNASGTITTSSTNSGSNIFLANVFGGF